jgi:ribonuclease HII
MLVDNKQLSDMTIEELGSALIKIQETRKAKILKEKEIKKAAEAAFKEAAMEKANSLVSKFKEEPAVVIIATFRYFGSKIPSEFIDSDRVTGIVIKADKTITIKVLDVNGQPAINDGKEVLLLREFTTLVNYSVH